ncbi:MAG: hypothetical protein HQ567_19325 [Candidatus Nealsonbacteria bacterium]|nr:hypothetical protein [Candidatus Nealsonbacteria bacterium]
MLHARYRIVLLCAVAALLPAPSLAAGEQRPATVLLVTDRSLAEAWRPLADWKTRAGKATEIVTVQDIDAKYQGNDVQEKIRACVLEHIDQRGTRWVILGGDSQPGGKGLVPDRDTPHPTMRVRDLPTDIYYISEKTWDADGDGVYGDLDGDREAIAYVNPKACIGRIPVRSAADVAAYTQKVIDYESRYPGDGLADQFVYTCPEPGAFAKLRTSAEQISKAWDGGKVRRFYSTESPWDKDKPGDYDLTPDHWVKMLNDRTAGKIHIHGHGLLSVWVLERGSTVTAKHVAQLRNRNAYPVMTTVSCYTGQYDGKQDPAITESMLRQPAAGAIAIVAPSRPGVPVFHNPRVDFPKMLREGKMDGTTQLMTLFWQLGLGKNLTTGEALSAAKAAMTADAVRTAGYHWCLCEINLLGDPTLSMRAKAPTTPKVTLPDRIVLGNRTLTVKTDTPGATVCVWKGDEVYAVVEAADQGAAVLPIAPHTPGTMLVTVSGPNLNTVTTSVPVGK